MNGPTTTEAGFKMGDSGAVWLCYDGVNSHRRWLQHELGQWVYVKKEKKNQDIYKGGYGSWF